MNLIDIIFAFLPFYISRALVGLEPINGFQEGKSKSTNDQLPSTEAVAAAPSAMETATTSSAPATATPLTLPDTDLDAIVAASVPSTTEQMEIDVDAPNIDLSSIGVDASDVPQAIDLESDVLREFLESETADLSATDDVGIEQMLMA